MFPEGLNYLVKWGDERNCLGGWHLASQVAGPPCWFCPPVLALLLSWQTSLPPDHGLPLTERLLPGRHFTVTPCILQCPISQRGQTGVRGRTLPEGTQLLRGPGDLHQDLSHPGLSSLHTAPSVKSGSLCLPHKDGSYGKPIPAG